MTTPPNVLVIVLDCVRQSDFPGGSNPPDNLPFLTSVRKEFATFPRTVSPAPWTLPSHVSLLTGQYPWEHNVHGKGATALAPGSPGIAPTLKELGYHSLLVSHNWLVSPNFGIGEGFDSMGWGAGYSLYLRVRRDMRPPHGSEKGWTAPDELQWMHSHSRMIPIRGNLTEFVCRYPWLMDATTRVGRRFNGIDPSIPPVIGPWLEPTLERWLQGQPADHPVFCFVNLLDAHEPFLIRPGRKVSVTDWIRLGLTRADHRAWLLGEWRPKRRQLAVLHELYRDAVELLDARIQKIVQAFQAAGRWDNTLCVITSDHGQAFGENGHLFHGFRTFEPLIRIPLWVRWPHGEHAGASGIGWSSLVDVPATILEAVGGDARRFPGTVPLSQLIDSERNGPVFALGDGLHWGRYSQMSADRKNALDRLEIAGFQDHTRYLGGIENGELTSVDLDDRGFERSTPVNAKGNGTQAIASQIHGALDHITGRATATIPKELSERLGAWGY